MKAEKKVIRHQMSVLGLAQTLGNITDVCQWKGYRGRSFTNGSGGFRCTVDHLHADLDVWLNFYNNERPHQGYRNMGRKPIETNKQYVRNET